MDDAFKQREANERERREELDRAEDPDASRWRRAQRSRSGVWFNRAAVFLIDIPFEHRLSPLSDGWRLEATTAGELSVRFVDGKERRFEFHAGDHLSRSGDELYLFIAPDPTSDSQSAGR